MTGQEGVYRKQDYYSTCINTCVEQCDATKRGDLGVLCLATLGSEALPCRSVRSKGLHREFIHPVSSFIRRYTLSLPGLPPPFGGAGGKSVSALMLAKGQTANQVPVESITYQSCYDKLCLKTHLRPSRRSLLVQEYVSL